jgi:hypothetical protein
MPWARDAGSREPRLRCSFAAAQGWVYSLSNGLVNDLGVTVSRPEEIERLNTDGDAKGMAAKARCPVVNDPFKRL